MGYESTCRAICYSATKFGIRGLMDGLHELSRLDKLNIKVTTVYPALVNTRKNFIDLFSHFGGLVSFVFRDDFLKQLNPRQLFFSLNAASQLGSWTPEEVAKATVDGILKDKKYVSMPCFLTKLITLLQ